MLLLGQFSSMVLWLRHSPFKRETVVQILAVTNFLKKARRSYPSSSNAGKYLCGRQGGRQNGSGSSTLISEVRPLRSR